MPSPPTEPTDPSRAGGHRAHARLVALYAAGERAPDPPDPAGFAPGPSELTPEQAEPVLPDAPAVCCDAATTPAATGPRIGRLVRRWAPAPLREARWDPGRHGALMLSAVAALAALLAALGVWWDRPVPEPVPALPILPAAAPASPTSGVGAPGGELVVSVVGRVVAPGLVRVPDGARVADALDAAGGPLPGSDLSLLNLARRVADGEQLLVGIAPPPGQPVDGGVLGAPAPGGAVTARPVDLNTATLEQLDTLPGVGPVTAQRILDWRAANGRFSSVDQLREVDGIGEVRFAKLKDRVRV